MRRQWGKSLHGHRRVAPWLPGTCFFLVKDTSVPVANARLCLKTRWLAKGRDRRVAGQEGEASESRRFVDDAARSPAARSPAAQSQMSVLRQSLDKRDGQGGELRCLGDLRGLWAVRVRGKVFLSFQETQHRCEYLDEQRNPEKPKA